MRFAAVLNRDGGTLRTIDIDSFCARLRRVMEEAGHKIDIHTVNGGDVDATLDSVASRRGIDVVLVGGGDGTISTAATKLMGKKKALAILPAGTMNLFARGLGIPQSLDAALTAFADGEIIAVDIASANDSPFIHQFSIGMHAKMVHLREKMDFGTRWGKIRASVRAAWLTIKDPPTMRVKLKVHATEFEARTTGVGVTNNLFGEGHLPYADDPAGGMLGIYVTVARQRRELVGFFFNMARGRWRDNKHVEIHETEQAVLMVRPGRAKLMAVMDGELVKLAQETIFKIHPRALNVLVPRRQPKAKAA